MNDLERRLEVVKIKAVSTNCVTFATEYLGNLSR